VLKATAPRAIAAAIVSLVLALLAVPSAGGGVWQVPVNLSAGGQEADSPQVALDPQGNAVAVWRRSNGPNYIVQGAVRPAGGGVWRAPVDLSAAGGDAGEPQVAVDPQGNAVAVWDRFNGANYIVQGAVRPAGSGVWQAPVNLSAAGRTAGEPQVAVDPQGNAVAVWDRSDGANTIVQGAVRPAGSGVWQAPVDLSAAGRTAGEPQVAVDPQGNAVAVWDRSDGTNTIVQGAVRPAGSGVWQAPVDLSAAGGPGESASNPQVAVDPQGNAVAVWDRSNGAKYIVQGAVRPAGGGVWQAPVNLSADGEHLDRKPQVAVDPQGNAVAVWDRFNGADHIVQGAVRPAGGGVWQAPVNLSAASRDVFEPQVVVRDASEPQVAIDPQGNAVAVWHRFNLTNTMVQGAVRPAGSGVWQAPVNLSAAGRTAVEPQVALDPHGNAVAVWDRTNGANYIVQGAGYDAAGLLPSVTNVTQSHRSWLEGKALAHTSARRKSRKKLPVGTTFSFSLNEHANVSFAFTQRVAGQKVKGKCVAKTRKNRMKPSCERTVTQGTLSFTGHTGTNGVSFQGRISASKRLRPGRYTLLITATDAAGQRSQTQSLSFTIVK
jgi:hypothetical protein